MAKTAHLVLLNATSSSRVSPALARLAGRAGWRVVRAGRPSQRRLMALLRRLDPGPAVLIDIDLPPPARDALVAAVAALARQDMVLGPSEDGGYWLLGLARRRRVPPGLLQPLARPVGDALADTVARVPMKLWQVELLALEEFPRLSLSEPIAADAPAAGASARPGCRGDDGCRADA